MQIRSQCPKCGKIQILDKQAADRRLRCADCRHLYSVPSLDKMPRATQIIEQSRSHLYVDEEGNTFA
jgi:DNA-directed RNA polymerase subunit M/transcription elongation factor TFIIS